MTKVKITTFTDRFSKLVSDYVDGGGTQQEFAKLLGVSRQTIGAWANGDRSPKQPTVEFIADKLDVDVAWLYGFDVEKKPAHRQEPTPKHRILFDRTKELTDKQMDIVIGVVDGLLEKDDDNI